MINQLLELHPLLVWIFAGFFFLCIGSFLNVVIFRLPQMLKSEWAQDCRELFSCTIAELPKINLFFPRSFCPGCKTMITAWQNIPLLSFILLRGKCGHCKTKIPLRYPLIELSTLVLSLYACWVFGFTLTGLFALLFIWLSLCLIMIDFDLQLLPDNLTLSLLWLGLLANTQAIFTPLPNAVLSAAGAYLGLWAFIKLFYLITGKIGMGNGDFKLFAAFGAWFGWQLLPLILLIASFTGGICGILYLRLNHQSRDTPIAFGPFLGITGIITLFWGQTIFHWYWGLWGLS